MYSCAFSSIPRSRLDPCAPPEPDPEPDPALLFSASSLLLALALVEPCPALLPLPFGRGVCIGGIRGNVGIGIGAGAIGADFAIFTGATTDAFPVAADVGIELAGVVPGL